MNSKFQAAKYIFFDLLGSALAWTVFFLYRKHKIDRLVFGDDNLVNLDPKYYLGLIIIPLFWLAFYFMFGFYKDVFRRSRLNELGQSLWVTALGLLVIFFTVIIDDVISSYKNYYQLMFYYFSFQFLATYIPRLFITILTIRKIRRRKWGFKTLIIGSGQKANNIYNALNTQKNFLGNQIVGFVKMDSNSHSNLPNQLENLGHINDILKIIYDHKIQEVIIAIEEDEHNRVGEIINLLYNAPIKVKVIPSMYDILMGKVKMSTIIGTPLIEISHDLMPIWQQTIKTGLDFLASFIAIILTSPLSLSLVIIIKLTSKGPIFYSHERIGRFGKPFTIYKFRSMYTDAEANGPALSKKNDPRITPIGKFMRKSRLDEIPNFFNVLRGDMSLVGPRPERQFFIDQITQKAPHYVHLQKVKPGITSWGQVKYGYAENVDQMVERLQYDLLYLENMSLYVDFKIMIYTLIIVFKGRGL